MKKFLAALCLALALPAHAATNEISARPADLRSILQEFHQRMATVKSVYMEYRQERVMKLFSEPLLTDGVMLLGQPNRLRKRSGPHLLHDPGAVHTAGSRPRMRKH